MLTVLGLGVVAVLVYFQTHKLGQVIQNQSMTGVELSEKARSLRDQLALIRFSLASAYITQDSDRIASLRDQSKKELEAADLTLSELEKFNSSGFANSSLVFTENGAEQKKTFQEILKEIDQEEGQLKTSVASLFSVRLESVVNSKALSKNKIELSKLYRASGDLKKYNSELYGQLSRAVITAMSSTSVRDLQFAGRKILDDSTAEYKKIKLSAKDSETLTKMISIADETLSLATKVYASSDDFDIFNSKLEGVLNRVAAVHAFSVSTLNESQEELLTTAGSTRNIAVGTSLVVGFLCMLIGLLISKNLIGSLTAIVNHLSQAGDQVSRASSHMQGTSGELSAGAQKSSSSLEETSASLTEISSMIATNAQNAETCAKVGKVAVELAENGQKEVQSLITSIRQLAQRSKKIEEISVIIEDIAFQTNLLALNAAVEAARAGDQGKGFAVVADAVRSLAQRSAESAKNISGLIQESVQAAQQGSQVADRSDSALKKIHTSVEELSSLSLAISEACRQQSSGISQIQIAMQELERVSQGNADSASSTAESSGTLSQEAENLNSLVQDLRVLMGGENSQPQKNQYEEQVEQDERLAA